MNKKLLHKSIMESVSKVLGKTLNEGAGAGYDVTFDGLNVNTVEVKKYELKGNDRIVRFTATLSKSIVEWKAIGYYEGVTSDGVYYNDYLAEEFDDLQKTVKGGKLSGYVYFDDVENRKPTWDSSKVNKNDVYNFIKDWLTDFSFTTMYGAGWSHKNLQNPMIFENIEIEDNYSSTYVFIDTIEINAPEIAETINWYFDNYLDFDKIYGDELDESAKIKTKKKSVTEDLTKADKEDAESKMDKWHEGKRKQNVKACSTDKLIMNFGICKRKGYDSEAEQIQDELDSRGINESQVFDGEVSEHNFGPEFDEVIEHVKNGTVDAEKDSEILFDALVPGRGDADNLGGELLRAAERIAYRYYNDGDMAGEGYGRETVNPAVRYMMFAVRPTTSPLYSIVKDFYRFVERSYVNVSAKEYEFMVMRLLKLTVIHIVENKLWDVPNENDMLDFRDPNVDVDRRYDWEEDDDY